MFKLNATPGQYENEPAAGRTGHRSERKGQTEDGLNGSVNGTTDDAAAWDSIRRC